MLTAAEYPPALPAPLDARQRDTLKALKARSKVLACDLHSAPEVLLQAKDYELLVREAAGEGITSPLHWQGWRAERIVEPLRAWLMERGR